MNNDASLSKLQELTTLERQLWDNFVNAEKGARIGLLNARKQYQVWLNLKGKRAGIDRYYPVFQFLPFFTSLSTPFLNGEELGIVLSIYMVSLALAAFTYKGFSDGYTQTLTGRTGLVRKAFGIDQISHRTFMMFERMSSSSAARLEPKTLDSIIKLVKAAQEHEAATFGYSDYFHRTFVNALFTLPFVLPALYFSNSEKVNLYTAKFRAAYIDGRLGIDFLISVLLLLAAAMLLLYMVGYGDRASIKKKKRYLLMLNVLKESYVEHIPEHDEAMLIQRAIDVIHRATALSVKVHPR